MDDVVYLWLRGYKHRHALASEERSLDLLLNIVERLISLVRQYDRYSERAFCHAKEV